MEKRYHALTGGRSFPKPNSSMKEVRRDITTSVVTKLKEKYCKKKNPFFPSGFFFNLDELLKQELLHISEPDLAHVDGPPHSPCPSSASFSSSHIPSPELCPVRLQEVNLKKKILFVTKPNKS